MNLIEVDMELTKRLMLEPLIAEYDTKCERVLAEIDNFKQSITNLEYASTVQGTYGGGVMRTVSPPGDHAILKSLRVSAWRHVYVGMKINEVLPASDKAKFERALEDPPEFSMENLKSTFGPYIMDPRSHILRGLAEAFCVLDKAYKSHSNIRIGVKKLPKRVIMANVFDSWGYSYSRERVTDLINALRLYQDRGLVTTQEVFDAIDEGLDGLTFKKFQNGNLHVIFDPQTCLDINRALAEYYGDVLPDAQDQDPTKKASTAVAKDLQYYPTPMNVGRAALRDVYVREGAKVLEPSCGDGRLLDVLSEQSKEGTMIGYEVDATRAQEARDKGYNVVTGNFLDVPMAPEFDYVVMNPPFYGRHYLAHLYHAIGFLKPGGTLIAILPATAKYDHKKLPSGGQWHDLPVGSFAESGTNVPTGTYTYRNNER